MKAHAAGTIIYFEHESKILKTNKLKDAFVRTHAIYIPPSYQHAKNQYYPAIYWLAGFGSTGLTLLNSHALSSPLNKRVDALIATGEISETIIIFPDCSTKFGGSQYINSELVGNYQDYLTDELVNYVETHFRIIPDKTQRAIIGRSSGGFGALMAVMQRPDVFANAACIAPDCGFEYCYLPFIPKVMDTIKHYGRYDKFVTNPRDIYPKDSNYMLAMSLIAMASCYSPNLNSKYQFDFICDTQTGEFRDEVWQRWLAYDPIRLVETYQSILQNSLRLYIDVGNRDEYYMHYGARVLHDKLNKLQIKHDYLEFDGGHQGHDLRYDLLVKYVVAQFVKGDITCAV
jgi:enterochelin esterase-like enzyme